MLLGVQLARVHIDRANVKAPRYSRKIKLMTRVGRWKFYVEKSTEGC
jgi:hypothetical protein